MNMYFNFTKAKKNDYFLLSVFFCFFFSSICLSIINLSLRRPGLNEKLNTILRFYNRFAILKW